jgi:hypothetical protein
MNGTKYREVTFTIAQPTSPSSSPPVPIRGKKCAVKIRSIEIAMVIPNDQAITNRYARGETKAF